MPLDGTTSAEGHDDPPKPFHLALLDADKLKPNRLVPNKPNHCGFDLKQRGTVGLIDPETQGLAAGDQGAGLYRTALSRQVDHGSLTRHLLAGKGQLEPNRNPDILSTAVVAGEAAPPPFKGEKSVGAELAAKGIDAEDTHNRLEHAMSWRLLNKVLFTPRAMRKPHREPSMTVVWWLSSKPDPGPRRLTG